MEYFTGSRSIQQLQRKTDGRGGGNIVVKFEAVQRVSTVRGVPRDIAVSETALIEGLIALTVTVAQVEDAKVLALTVAGGVQRECVSWHYLGDHPRDNLKTNA